MDFGNIGRNDPCPCGSGKKFKKCHLGRETELVEEKFSPDPAQVARDIARLPAARHSRAVKMASALELTSAAGKKIVVRPVDLAAYLKLNLHGRQDPPQGGGGLVINPTKTRVLEPDSIYIALSPDANDSTVVHQLAHVVDLLHGSRLPMGTAGELAADTGVPVELLEHPQEFGDRLLELGEKFEVEFDAEDEIVAFLARRKMLLPAAIIADGTKKPLVAAAEKAMRVLKENQDEINARIKKRQGYIGDRKK